jgi:hypothetical protein
MPLSPDPSDPRPVENVFTPRASGDEIDDQSGDEVGEDQAAKNREEDPSA